MKIITITWLSANENCRKDRVGPGEYLVWKIKWKIGIFNDEEIYTYLVIAAELVVFHVVLQVEIEIMFLNNLNCIRDYELLQISFGFERISYWQFKMEQISLHKSKEVVLTGYCAYLSSGIYLTIHGTFLQIKKNVTRKMVNK
jgi:hypothetical protein